MEGNAQIYISERPQRAFGSIRRMAWGTRLKEKRPVRKAHTECESVYIICSKQQNCRGGLERVGGEG